MPRSETRMRDEVVTKGAAPDTTEEMDATSLPSEVSRVAPAAGQGSEGEERRRPPRTVGQLVRNLLIKLVAIALAVWATLTFVLSVSVHYGNNMHPALKDGDLVVALRLQRPYIDAAVIYRHDGEKRVGRVVALGGTDVDITAVGELRVNKVVPAEEVFYPTFAAEDSDVAYPYHVGEGQAFVLNDFRSDADDSRSFGAIGVDEIDGPIIFSMRIRGF